MKKLALILILFVLPLIAQDAVDLHDSDVENVQTNESVWEGLILEIDGTNINFEEMWISIATPADKLKQPIIITDATGLSTSYGSLRAPCLVELTYKYVDGEIDPLKIKILEQYEYDKNGFIKKGIY